MPYLIDGSNLGGVVDGARGARDPAMVLRALAAWSDRRGHGEASWVIFDGAARSDVARRYGRLEVRFAAPRSADELILERVGKTPEAFTVVTDDRGLAVSVRAAGGRVVSARAFWSEVVAPRLAPRPHARRASAAAREDEKPAPGAEGAHWRRVFGGED